MSTNNTQTTNSSVNAANSTRQTQNDNLVCFGFNADQPPKQLNHLTTGGSEVTVYATPTAKEILFDCHSLLAATQSVLLGAHNDTSAFMKNALAERTDGPSRQVSWAKYAKGSRAKMHMKVSAFSKAEDTCETDIKIVGNPSKAWLAENNLSPVSKRDIWAKQTPLPKWLLGPYPDPRDYTSSGEDSDSQQSDESLVIVDKGDGESVANGENDRFRKTAQ